MIPVLKWYEKLLAWFLIRIESKNSWSGGFSDKKDGMKWLISEDHLLYSSICGLMRDYIITQLYQENEKR